MRPLETALSGVTVMESDTWNDGRGFFMEAFRAENPDHPALSDYAALLRDQALLLEGSPAKEPARFARLVSRLMVDGK